MFSPPNNPDSLIRQCFPLYGIIHLVHVQLFSAHSTPVLVAIDLILTCPFYLFMYIILLE